MKRQIFLLITSFCFFMGAFAQEVLEKEQLRGTAAAWKKGWHFGTFGNLSLGNVWSPMGNYTSLGMPAGFQLTRELSKNWFAYGSVSAAPVFFHFKSVFNHSAGLKPNNGYNLMHARSFGVIPRAEAGLFYINDQKTFSVSGSVFVERNNYPFYPSFGGNSRPMPLAF